MSRHHSSVAVLAIALAAALSSVLTPPSLAAARPGRPIQARELHLLAPSEGERVSESTGSFELEPGDLGDVHIVVSREEFDPSGWTALPGGSRWMIFANDVAAPLRLASLSLGTRAETPLWWTAAGIDRATGELRASEVRRFVVVPRFANRVAPDARLLPSAIGSIALPAPADGVPVYRPIPLASGRIVQPDAPALSSTAAPRSVSPAGAGGRRPSLVQFADGTADSARVWIERAGAAIVAPISGEAYLVRMDDAAAARLATTGRPWIAAWQPEDKLSTLVDRASAAPLELTALLFPDGDDDATAAALVSLGAASVRVERGSVNHLLQFTVDAARLGDVSALADVEWLEPTAHDSLLNDQAQWVTQTGTSGSRRVWDMGIRGRGQVVMTSDSGIRPTHEMFFDSTTALNTWGDFPTHRKIIAYWPGSDSPLIQFGDDVGSEYHGTHTAGTVAGNPDPSSGAPWSGMAKDAKLYFMDMSGPAIGGSLATPPDLNDLFAPSYTGNAGGAARISSNSWGNGQSFGHYLIQSMQVDQFMWNHPDYLIAFAAGNVGVLTSVQAPGTAKNCLTVGATGNGALANQLAPWSSGGPTNDLRYKPTLAAPGDGVTSSIGSTRFTYATYSGTSMSTPVVAGTVALIREYLTEGWYPTGAPMAANAFDPSAALLKAMAVCASRNDVLPYTSPNNRSGWGRLTADDVLYFPGDSSHTLLVDGDQGLLDRQYVEYQVRVTDPSRPLKVVLCWTDAPGNPASAIQLVNDLDLSVSNGAVTYLGNRLLNFNSATGGPRDSLNVEEVVRLASPGVGLWTVRVDAHRVLQGPQPFGLCITGGVGGSAGSVALDRFDYRLTDTLGVEVLDANATSPPSVTVSSTTDPYGERVQLAGANGVYHGSFPIGPVAPQPGDGILAVSSGDRVTVSYADSDPEGTVSTSGQVNAQAPIVGNVHATPISGTSALVTWTTDLAATSRVRYGLASPGAALADSAGLTTQHGVVLTGLAAAQTYRYDVESATRTGSTTADSLGGLHRTFTLNPRGDIALVMDDPDAATLACWTNALTAIGLRADVITRAGDDPPLVGNAQAGLRSYAAVLWQVDPDRYPPFSSAQRAAVDSLLEGGGRLLVTGHDMGWGLSDMSSPSYSPEGEAWIESGLKTRYFFDVSWVDTLRGHAGDPVTGDFVAGVKYHPEMYPDAGDMVSPAPGTDGVGVEDWLDDNVPAGNMGIHWESNAAKGAPGTSIWAGSPSRLVGLFYEWRALSSTGSAQAAGRTSVLERSVDWLLGRRPPSVVITSPVPGAVVTGDFLPIRYVTSPDSGRSIANRSLDYSLDGGETWASMATMAYADSGYIWDLGGALGGPNVPNATRVQIRLSAMDDGAPMLRSVYTIAGTITLNRPAGDLRGPVLVAGSAGTSPSPLQRGSQGTLSASFSDAETGGGVVVAAEYWIGVSPAPAGSGQAMTGTFGSVSVTATAALDASGFASGAQYVWLRARDSAGNWGPAAVLTATANDRGMVSVGDGVAVDFLAPASPNPSFGPSTLRFGLARAGSVRMELFDLAGRRVRTLVDAVLPAGVHAASWDGRDDQSNRVHAGVYFLRLETPARRYAARLVRLE